MATRIFPIGSICITAGNWKIWLFKCPGDFLLGLYISMPLGKSCWERVVLVKNLGS